MQQKTLSTKTTNTENIKHAFKSQRFKLSPVDYTFFSPRCIKNTESGLPGLSRTIYVHFSFLSTTFNRVDIKQASYAKQQIEQSLTVDNDNVCKGQKQEHRSEMRQPFRLFSMTFQDLGLIP